MRVQGITYVEINGVLEPIEDSERIVWRWVIFPMTLYDKTKKFCRARIVQRWGTSYGPNGYIYRGWHDERWAEQPKYVYAKDRP